MSSPSAPRRDVLALILAAAAWGVGTVISKFALESIPPLTLLPVQLASSLGVLVVLMRRRGVSMRDARAAPILGRLGLLNPGLAYALSLLGLASITASLSVLLWATEPLMILALAAVFLRERVSASLVVLSMVAVIGMVLVIADPSGLGDEQAIGVALTLAGVACCAVYTVVARRWLSTAESTAQVVFTQQAYGLAFAVVVLAVVAILGGAVQPTSITGTALAAAIASGALYYAGAYWLYLGALRGVPASRAAVSFYLIPVFGVAAGVTVLGERLDQRQWLGAGLVIIAVALILRRQPGGSGITIRSPGDS